MSPVVYGETKLAKCRAVAAEFVFDDDAGLAPAGYQSGNEPLCSPCIAARLYQDIKNLADAIYCTPKLVFHAADHDHHLVQVPFIRGLTPCSSDMPSNRGAEFPDPDPDCLVNHHDPSLCEQNLNVTQAEGETMVGPDRMGNDEPGEAVALKARLRYLTDHGANYSKARRLATT